jgi:flagellar hook-length control protein FliK
VILIPAIISGIIDAVSGHGSANSGAASQPATPGDTQFKSLVAALTANGQRNASSAAPSTPKPANAAAAANAIVQQMVGKNALSSDAARKLSERITALLQSGVSMAQIVSTLASKLAQQVGAAIGKTDDASLASLRTAFATALSPPSNGPPDAAALMSRLRKVAAIASRVLNDTTGQQNRLTGNTLDAKTAGGNPAPNQTQATAKRNGAPAQGNGVPQGGYSTESILQGAFAALSGPVDSPQVAAQLSSATPGASQNAVSQTQTQSGAASQLPASATPPLPASATPPPASTEALVASSSLDAAGTGGGTLLGRTLTRAANVAADLGPNPLTAWSAPASHAPTLAPSTPQQASSDAKGGSTNPGGNAATAALAAASGTASAPNATVAAFLQTFERALSASANAVQPDPLSDQNQSDDTNPIGSNNTTIGNGQSLLASLGVPQTTQPTTSNTPDLPVAAQTAPTTDPNAVVAQLVRGLTMNNTGESSQVRLRLVPENLGDLNVKLTVDRNGSVSASVLTHTPEARDAIVANQGQLQRSLADAGLKLTSFSVDLSNGGANMFAQHQQPQTQQRFGFDRRSMLVSNDTNSESDPLSAVPSFAPPALAAAASGALNYLV